MTPNISQHVLPRANGSKARHSTPRSLQRGSVDSATLTLGVTLIIIVTLGMLGLFYLQQVVHTADAGNDIRSLEGSIIDLKERQKTLELDGARLRSLKNVEDRAKEMNLVPADKVSYLAPVQDRVAVNVE